MHLGKSASAQSNDQIWNRKMVSPSRQTVIKRLLGGQTLILGFDLTVLTPISIRGQMEADVRMYAEKYCGSVLDFDLIVVIVL